MHGRAFHYLILVALAPFLAGATSGRVAVEPLPALPRPVSNNAVAGMVTADGVALFSLLGLEAGKSWRDTTAAAFMLPPGAPSWHRLPDVPGRVGRLAATAVAVAGLVYVFGGYSVAEDGSEVSTPFVHAFDPRRGEYAERTSIPVPVDDSLALPLGDRYVYLVSGWHDSGNVNLVQVYDVVANTWAQATPFPGRPVFGHAGGIANRTIVVCDGVAIRIDEVERRAYEMTDGCYRGEVDARDPRRIDWFALDPHPGAARYRMAAVGTSRDGGWIVFAGGTDNPYNYNGIGYDGRPSEPRADLFAYSVERAQWHELGPLEVATMDHRALIDSGDGFIIVGGMGRGREVSASVFRFDPALP